MARSPLDNVSTAATMEGWTPQNGKETRGSEKVLADHSKPKESALEGAKLVARDEPGSKGSNMGDTSLKGAMKHLAKDHGKKAR